MGLGGTIGPGLSLDYFLARNISVGGQLSYSNDTLHQVQSANVLLRVGFDWELSDEFSVWSHLGLGYSTSSIPVPTTDPSTTQVNTSSMGYVSVDSLLLYHVSNHFFLGAGLSFQQEFYDESTSDTNKSGVDQGLIKINENLTTTLGITSTIGGHF